MSATVATERDKKYRNLTVIPGGAPQPYRGRRRGRRLKTAAELLLEREIRTAFAALEDADGNVPSEAIQKIREGVQIPLGVFGRRIIEAHAAKCEHAKVRKIGERIIEWIDRLYDTSGETIVERVYLQSPRRCA